MEDEDIKPPKLLKLAKVVDEKMGFDDPDPNLHDIVLIVDEQKFYCSKITLAKHSDYFYKMFFGEFAEKGKKEILLQDPESPEEFQAFLETINGVKCLTDDKVHGLLRLACRWFAEVVKNRCIEYVGSAECKKEIREKFNIAVELGLEKLMTIILAGIRTTAALHELIPINVMDLNHAIMGLVFKKSLELSGTWPVDPDEIRILHVGPIDHMHLFGEIRRQPSPQMGFPLAYLMQRPQIPVPPAYLAPPPSPPPPPQPPQMLIPPIRRRQPEPRRGVRGRARRY